MTSLPPMKWNAWGDPAAAKPLSDGIRSLLRQALGVDGRARRGTDPRAGAAAPVGAVRRRPRRPGRDRRRRALRRRRPRPAAARRRQVDTGPVAAQGLRRAGRARRGAAARRRGRDRRDCCGTASSTASRSCRSAAAPAWSAASTRSAATSAPWSRWTCADSTQLHSLDEVSGEAELGAGVTGPEAERLLGERGFSLGHFPQSFQFATIGGFAATRSSGQDSAGYGRFDDMVRGLRAVTPAGVLDLGRAPASAAGPGPASAAARLRGRCSGSSPGCGCGCIPSRRPPATRRGRSPTSPPAPTRCARSCRPAPGPP